VLTSPGSQSKVEFSLQSVSKGYWCFHYPIQFCLPVKNWNLCWVHKRELKQSSKHHIDRNQTTVTKQNQTFLSIEVQGLKPVILATREVEIMRIMVEGQPRQKIWETPFQPMAGNCSTLLSFQLCGKAQVRGWQSSWPEHKARPYLKNKQHNKGWQEVLSSTPSTAKKRKDSCPSTRFMKMYPQQYKTVIHMQNKLQN
jgi:hypothetical protein